MLFYTFLLMHVQLFLSFRAGKYIIKSLYPYILTKCCVFSTQCCVKIQLENVNIWPNKWIKTTSHFGLKQTSVWVSPFLKITQRFLECNDFAIGSKVSIILMMVVLFGHDVQCNVSFTIFSYVLCLQLKKNYMCSILLFIISVGILLKTFYLVIVRKSLIVYF